MSQLKTLAWLWLLMLASYGPVYAALTTSLKEFPGVSVTMGEASCPDPVAVDITANTRDQIVQPRLLARAMAWAQINLQTECPTAETINVTGMVTGKKVYSATARRSDQWRLVEVAGPVLAASSAGSSLAAASGPAIPSSADEQKPSSAPAVLAVTDMQTARAIRQCDASAAHPDDPESFTAGITDAKLDAKAAITFCEAAVKADPQTPRLHFQLGRAYLKADRYEEATEQFIVAAEDAHGGALAYLGDIYIDGAPGIDADFGTAKALYEKAAASGFLPAAKVLAEFEDKTDMVAQAEKEESLSQENQVSTPPSSVAYRWPAVIEAISKAQFDDVPAGEIWSRKYLYAIADNLASICDNTLRKGAPIFTKSQLGIMESASRIVLFPVSQGQQFAVGLAVASKALPSMQQQGMDFWKNPGKYLNQKQEVDPEQQLFEDALNDTSAFLTTNGCQGKAVDGFAKNLGAFVTEPISYPTDGVLNRCVNQGGDATLCQCFAGTINLAPISRHFRKALFSEQEPFMKVARTIRGEYREVRFCFGP